MNSVDLQEFIDQNHIRAVILPMAEHTVTVSDAARELQVETDQVIKSLIFVVNSEPLLVICNGYSRVDKRKLAVYLDVGRKRIKFANPESVPEMTGYIVGSMPPFGHGEALRTLVDPAVCDQAVIYGGGGDLDAMMKLTPAELIKVTGAEVVALSE